MSEPINAGTNPHSASSGQTELVDSNEVAQMLKITANTLQIWRHQGKGPRYVKLSRRAVRYRKKDILDWVQNSMIETEATLKKEM